MTGRPESPHEAAGWQPIETAPRDGSEFWGNEGYNAIKMLWHPRFFLKTVRRIGDADVKFIFRQCNGA